MAAPPVEPQLGRGCPHSGTGAPPAGAELEVLFHSTEVNRKLYLVFFDFVSRGARSERFRKLFSEFFEKCRQRDTRIVEDGIREQQFRRVNPVDAASTIRALVDGYCLQWLMGLRTYRWKFTATAAGRRWARISCVDRGAVRSKGSADLSCRSASFRALQRSPARFTIAPQAEGSGQCFPLYHRLPGEKHPNPYSPNQLFPTKLRASASSRVYAGMNAVQTP